MNALVTTAALCVASVPAADAPRVLVGCDGPVEMTTDESGRTRLALSGGVRVARGGLSARARRGLLLLRPDGGEPESVLLEGEVEIESPRFAAEAGRAEFATATARPGDDVEPGGITVTLHPPDDRPTEVRVGSVRIKCAGPVTWREARRDIVLGGRLRAESETFVARAKSGLAWLAPAAIERPAAGRGSGEGADGGPGPTGTIPEPGEAPAEAWRLERLELDGPVEIATKAEGGAARRARAGRAVYVAAEDVLILTGHPRPEIESAGAVLTAPEIRLYLRDNRVESPGGPMRMIVEPAGTGARRHEGRGEGE